jgi:hypothetical protein
MLSNTTRSLIYLNALLYAVLGAFLFAMPERLAPVFAWKVSAFVTMTIGGWCLGNAWLAFLAARRWTWSLVQPSLIYLWLFGIGETLVVILFRDKLNLVHPIAWLYLATLAANLLAVAVGVIDLVRLKPAIETPSERANAVQKAGLIFFVVFVGFLGVYGSIIENGSIGTNGGIFPEPMSTFTLRSFGAFYLSLSILIFRLYWHPLHHNPRVCVYRSVRFFGAPRRACLLRRLPCRGFFLHDKFPQIWNG